jgi:arylsulfatase A-like enzyme
MPLRLEPSHLSPPWLAVAAALVALVLTPSPVTATPPDLVLINLDLLRADAVGLLGGSGQTPAIDYYFRRGTVFEQAQAPAGFTWLSNAAVLTGREAIEIPWMAWRKLSFPSPRDSLARDGVRLLSRFPTLAERLAAAGYATVNLNQGLYSGRHAGLDRGFEVYQELPVNGFVGDAVRALLEPLAKPRDRPLFVLFRPRALHYPYVRPASRERAPSRPGFVFDRPSRDGRRRITFATPLNDLTRTLGGPYDGDGHDPPVYRVKVLPAALELLVTRLDLEAIRTTYEQQVRYLDAELRRLFAELERRATPTVVVLYANHGESLGDHGFFGHGTPYQECVRVPLLIRHPDTAGQRIRVPVSLVGLLPTLCEIAGIPVDPDLPGHSLLPFLAGSDPPPHPLFGRNLQSAYVRDGRFKLIINEPGIRELYDLETDPMEKTDLAAAHPDLVHRLAATLTRRELELWSRQEGDAR